MSIPSGPFPGPMTPPSQRRVRVAAVLAALALLSGGLVAARAEAAPAALVPIVAPAQSSDRPPVVGKPGKPFAKGTKLTKQLPPVSKNGGVQKLTTCGSPSQCFTYVEASMSFVSPASSSGLSGDFTVAKPFLNSGDYHSLAEIAVRGTGNVGNTAEIGWNVDPALYGDSDPHLFVFYWINGTPQSYNGGCWVDYASTPTNVGANINGAVGGALKQFRLQYDPSSPAGGAWWGAYGGQWIGYFPSSCWTSAGQTFTSSSHLQAFGEIASAAKETCSDMGTGVQGNPWVVGGTAARISSMSAQGIAPATTSMTFWPTDPTSSAAEYSSGVPAGSVRSMSYGGPGWNSAGTGVGSTGSC